MAIAIGADSMGIWLKDSLIRHLENKGIQMLDVGGYDGKPKRRYYEVASDVARLIQRGEAEKGILLCGTGMGVAIVANKFKGIYAAVIESEFAALKAKQINNANVLCMGGWIVGPELAVEMTKTFLATDWCQDLEDWRAANMHRFAAQVAAIEDHIYEN